MNILYKNNRTKRIRVRDLIIGKRYLIRDITYKGELFNGIVYITDGTIYLASPKNFIPFVHILDIPEVVTVLKGPYESWADLEEDNRDLYSSKVYF